MCSPDGFLACLAILFPPIAVWIKVGICSADSLINLALCCLGYVPGLLHAWYIILKYPEHNEEYPDGYQPIVAHSGGYQDPDGNRVTYYYVAHQSACNPLQHPHAQRAYGTTPPFPQPQHQHPAPPVPEHPSSTAGQGSNSAPGQAGESSGGTRAPPTYAEAVKGDHKIQTQD